MFEVQADTLSCSAQYQDGAHGGVEAQVCPQRGGHRQSFSMAMAAVGVFSLRMVRDGLHEEIFTIQ